MNWLQLIEVKFVQPCVRGMKLTPDDMLGLTASREGRLIGRVADMKHWFRAVGAAFLLTRDRG